MTTPYRFAACIACAASLCTAQTVAPAASAPLTEEGRPPVQLNPFEVVEDTKGYFGANTMSGTRFNSRLEDLGAAITVITAIQNRSGCL